MTDHRAVQRTLLRMQLDPQFAGRVLAREAAAVASTGLGEEDLALLTELDPRAIEADARGERRMQITGNAASEYRLTVRLADRAGLAVELLGGFPASDELHRALREDGRLPLAFGAYAARVAEERELRDLAAVVELERALARSRRAPAERPARARAEEYVLSPAARLVDLPAGTMALAEALEAGALEAGAPTAAALDPTEEEHLMVLRGEAPSPHGLCPVTVEPLQPAVAALLSAAEQPLGPEGRAELAGRLGADADELEAFARELLGEGLLVRGSG